MTSISAQPGDATDPSVNVSSEWSAQAISWATLNLSEPSDWQQLPMHITFDASLSPAAKVVLLAMTAFARGGVVMVSQPELARRLGYSQQAVSKQQCELASRGFIERTPLAPRARTATWRLTFMPQPQVVPDPQPPVVDDDDSQPGVVDSQPAVVAHAPALSTPRTSSSTRTRSTKSSSSSTPPTLTDEDRAKIHQRYDSQFPGAPAVDELIDTSLNHVAVNKAKSPYLYALGWVRREAERYREHLARLATEQARQERARTPYAPTVTARPLEPVMKLTPREVPPDGFNRTRLAAV